MATATPSRPPSEPLESHLLLQNIAWDAYEAMLGIVGDRHVRVTFDAGTMEVSMPSQRHEQASQLLGLFIPRLAEELEIPYEPLGMTTWRRRDAEKGLEPDQCYYIRNEAIVRERDPIDLEIDPPPDLAIEIDITRSSLDRMGIYAGLGVAEVWRYDGRTLTIWGLEADGVYHSRPTSESFPDLTPVDVERFIDSGRTTDKLRWARELREWIRDEFLTRRDGA